MEKYFTLRHDGLYDFATRYILDAFYKQVGRLPECDFSDLLIEECGATIQDWQEALFDFKMRAPATHDILFTEYIEPLFDNTLVIKNSFVRTRLLFINLALIPKFSKSVSGLFSCILDQMGLLHAWKVGYFLTLAVYKILDNFDLNTIDFFIVKLDSLFYCLENSIEL